MKENISIAKAQFHDYIIFVLLIKHEFLFKFYLFLKNAKLIVKII